MASDPARRGNVTDEHRAEAARLKAIWLRERERLLASGVGSQEAFGQAAREACASDRRCRFVDGYAALEGVPQAHRPDGTHLTPAGYGALISAIRPALER